MLNLSYFKRENGDGYIPGDFLFDKLYKSNCYNTFLKLRMRQFI